LLSYTSGLAKHEHGGPEFVLATCFPAIHLLHSSHTSAPVRTREHKRGLELLVIIHGEIGKWGERHAEER